MCVCLCNKAVAAHESKRKDKNPVVEDDHPDEAQSAAEHQCEDVAMQDWEVAQGEVSPQECECEDVARQDCEVAQGDVAQECEVAQGDVAQECEVAQGDVAQECEKAQGGIDQQCSIPEGVLSRLVKHYTIHRPADPQQIHSQVLLRSASELEDANLQERPADMNVRVPDTPLRTPARSLAEETSTPSTVKVYRNTSSYKAAKSPIPFPLATEDVHMDQGEEATASGSNQMALAKELFPDMPAGSNEPMMVPLVMPLPDQELQDNPYSREAGLFPKREKESSVSIPTPQKPDTKKARLDEQTRLRQEMAEDVWSSVVYPLRDSVPDAMPRNLIFNGKLRLS